MATEVQAKAVLQAFGEQLTVPASNGTKTVFNRRRGYDGILIEPAAAMRLGFPPALEEVWVRSGAGVWRDILAGRKQGNANLSGSEAQTVVERGFTGQSLALLATDRLYLGFKRKVNDLFVDIGSTANATASVLTCENSNTAGFAALTITDGTDCGGATFATDGNITFTVPAGIGWTPRVLRHLFPGEPSAPPDNLFWLRFAVSVALDAGTLVDQIAGFIETDGAGTNSGHTVFLNAGVEYYIRLHGDVGAIQPIAQAAAATTANVSWVRS